MSAILTARIAVIKQSPVKWMRWKSCLPGGFQLHVEVKSSWQATLLLPNVPAAHWRISPPFHAWRKKSVSRIQEQSYNLQDFSSIPASHWSILVPLVILPIGFPIDSLDKQVEKITNSYHMIVGHLAKSSKSEPIAKHPKCNHMWGCNILQQLCFML